MANVLLLDTVRRSREADADHTVCTWSASILIENARDPVHTGGISVSTG
jgi:hypothetical protein